MSSEPGVVWIMALPMRPSAQPMPIFLAEPPKPPLECPFKVGQDKEGVIIDDGFSHGHLGEPFAAGHGEVDRSVFVHDIHRAEGPSVYLQRFPVLLGGIAVSLVVRVCLHDGGLGEIILNQMLHPGPGDDVGAVLLAGVEFDGHFSSEGLADAPIDFFESLGGQVSGKIYGGCLSSSLREGNIVVSAGSRHRFFCTHSEGLLSVCLIESL